MGTGTKLNTSFGFGVVTIAAGFALGGIVGLKNPGATGVVAGVVAGAVGVAIFTIVGLRSPGKAKARGRAPKRPAP